jgi:CheY-like chemotaxis protein
MSVQFPSEPPTTLRDAVRLLVDEARDHEDDLKVLVASAERDVQDTKAALLHATLWRVYRLRRVLRAQLRRRAEAADAAGQLCDGAHDHHAAARRFLTRLDVPTRTGDPHTDRPLSRDAVLVADDYGDVRDLLAYVLENAGFVVRTAANGLEALIAAYEMRPGVIVMDVAMPVLNGIEATRLIKATDAIRDARVIAYTANPTLDDSLVHELFVGVLQKPAAPAVVLATVRHAAGL